MSHRPSARGEDLVVEPLDDELLVFDSRVERAHSLNVSAAAVWRACDGTRDREALARHCRLEPMAVDLALESLAGCDLLVDFAPTSDGPRISRRSVLRRAAVTGVGLGVALPVIRSIAAPSAQAAALSGMGTGAPCGLDGGPCPGSTEGGSTSYCDSQSLCHSGSFSSHGYRAGCSPGKPCNLFYSCSNGTCISRDFDAAQKLAFRRERRG